MQLGLAVPGWAPLLLVPLAVHATLTKWQWFRPRAACGSLSTTSTVEKGGDHDGSQLSTPEPEAKSHWISGSQQHATGALFLSQPTFGYFNSKFATLTRITCSAQYLTYERDCQLVTPR